MVNQAKGQAGRPSIRLFVPETFSAGQVLSLPVGQAHYLAMVMRRKEGDAIALFNGQDGEWRAEITQVGKKNVEVQLTQPLLPQRPGPDVWLAFSPIKGKVEFVVEKAVELGVSRLLPVFTRRAVVTSVNEEKLRLTAIEAAEQCGRCDVPPITPCKDLAALLALWPAGRVLLHADENGAGRPLKDLVSGLSGALGVLVGPEGGFAPEEQQMLAAHTAVKGFGMGPRILRADTASVAALACVIAWHGDWHEQPHFTFNKGTA